MSEERLFISTPEDPEGWYSPEWEAKIDGLMADFGIEPEHREALITTLEAAIVEFQVEGIAIDYSIEKVSRRKEPANKLHKRVNKLKREVTETIAFALGADFPQQIELREERQRRVEEALRTIVACLTAVAEDAEVRVGKRRALRDGKNEPLRPAAKVLTEFWRGLRGSFVQDQGNWVNGPHDQEDNKTKKELEPTGDGERFVYSALLLVGLPRIRLRGLRTVLRDTPTRRSRRRRR